MAGLRAAAAVAPAAQGAAWSGFADALLAEVTADCLHPSGRWQRAPGDDRVDAALLFPALRGAIPPGDPRALATLEAARTELSSDGYMYRYRPDDRPLGEAEGAFLLCGFTMALALHQHGREVEAVRWFERNRAACGPPGLLTEEYDITAAAGARQRAAGLRARPAAGIGAAARRPMAGAGRAHIHRTAEVWNEHEHAGQVVVVTGASGGIGRATALAFAARGAKVALLARGEAGLDGAVRDVEQAGGTALPIPTDVADPDQVEAAAAQAEQALGPIDVWVNVAFTSVFAPFSEIGPAEYKRVTEVSYLGYVYGTMAALKRMLPRDAGTIVQVGSALAYRGIPLQSAYCGAKHAIQGFNESLRCELLHDKSNVRVTMVQMPAVNTPQFDWVLSRLPKRPAGAADLPAGGGGPRGPVRRRSSRAA